MEEGDGRNTGSPAGGAAHVNRQPARVRSGRQGGGEVRRYRGSRVMPAEGRDLRWKRWRKGAGSREWPTAYHPGDERESRSVITCTSEGDGPERSPSSGRQQACRHTGGPAQGCRPGATARQTRPPVADREPVCEPHDSTGEPGAGNRHAGFGERGEETYPWASDCGPGRKRRKRHRRPTDHAPPLDSTQETGCGTTPPSSRCDALSVYHNTNGVGTLVRPAAAAAVAPRSLDGRAPRRLRRSPPF